MKNEPYFNKVHVGDVVFGMIYGKGVVRSVNDNSHYTFEVEYSNGQVVPYTEDGIPGWGTMLDIQTVYYPSDVELTELDLEPVAEVLTPKKIIKLSRKKRLMARCPSGIWVNTTKCPSAVIEEYMESQKFHLFKVEAYGIKRIPYI